MSGRLSTAVGVPTVSLFYGVSVISDGYPCERAITRPYHVHDRPNLSSNIHLKISLHSVHEWKVLAGSEAQDCSPVDVRVQRHRRRQRSDAQAAAHCVGRPPAGGTGGTGAQPVPHTALTCTGRVRAARPRLLLGDLCSRRR